MAYQEVWQSPDDPTVTGYKDTDTGAAIPIDPGNRHYQALLAWIAGGGVPDPGYTAQEIADYQAAQAQQTADAYLQSTAGLVQRYRDDLAAGRRPFIPAAKYNNLLKKRARAQKLTAKTFTNF